MIDILLAAFEGTDKEKNSLWKNLKKGSWLIKGSFCIFAVGIVAMFVLMKMGEWEKTVIEVLIFTSLLFFASIALEREHRGKWQVNIENYNNKLDKIAELLKRKDFALYDKNKLKQLIQKYRRSIEETERQNEDRREKLSGFVKVYILPVVAFAAGNFVGGLDAVNVAATAILIIFLLVSTRFAVYSIKTTYDELTGNVLQKKKEFVAMLQDLLDRDFSIEKADLLEK